MYELKYISKSHIILSTDENKELVLPKRSIAMQTGQKVKTQAGTAKCAFVLLPKRIASSFHVPEKIAVSETTALHIQKNL